MDTNEWKQLLSDLAKDGAVQLGGAVAEAAGLAEGGSSATITIPMVGPVSKLSLARAETGEVTGSVQIGDREIQLTADPSGSPENLRLAGTLEPPMVLTRGTPAAAFSISRVAFEVSRQNALSAAVGGDPATTSGGTRLQLSTDARLRANDLVDLGGTATICRSDEGAGFRFEPSADSTINIPLPVAAGVNGQPSICLSVGAIEVLWSKTSGGVSFSGTCALSFSGLPAGLARLFPGPFAATLAVDGPAFTVRVERLPGPAQWQIPGISLGSRFVELGIVVIGASDLQFSIDNDVCLSLRFDLGLPSQLNRVFGERSDGDPAVKIFRSFDPVNPEGSTVGVRLTISRAGLAFKLEDSPFEAVRIQDGSCHCDFGEYGAVRFDVPTFRLDPAASAFRAAGAFEVIRTLKIPLTLIRSLFQACGLEDIARIIPSALPLTGLRLMDPNGDFRSKEFLSLLQSAVGTLPSGMDAVIDGIGTGLSRLPDGFKQYLNAEIPSSFAFDIDITPQGDVKIRAAVKEGDPPVRLLQPVIVGMMPGLLGIELRSIAFGECLGGSLFLAEIDACVDRFDVVTLAGSLLLPENHDLPLPQSRSLSNRIVIRRLLMVIIYETVIPIPVPIFYEELGAEYLGLEGLGFQIHLRFPAPQAGLTQVRRLLQSVRRFLVEREYLLTGEDLDGLPDLEFSLGPTFLQLPEYLGGTMLGSGAPTVARVSVLGTLSAFLNCVKTLDIDALVEALPPECRAGAQEWRLGPLAAHGKWIVTTPRQYSKGMAVPAPLPATVLPPDIAAPDSSQKGLISILDGKAGFGNAQVDILTAVALYTNKKFGAGFRFHRAISEFLGIDLSGRFAIDILRDRTGAAPLFSVAGTATLTAASLEVFRGDVSIGDRGGFALRGALDLFPNNPSFELRGMIAGAIGPEGLSAHGAVTANLFGMRLLEAGASLTNTSITIQGTWLGQTVTLRSEIRGERSIGFSGEVNLHVQFAANLGVIQKPRLGPIVQAVRVNAAGTLHLAVRLTEREFRAAATADISLDGIVAQRYNFEIGAAPFRVEDVIPQIQQRIVSAAAACFDQIYRDAGHFLNGVQHGVIDPIGDRVLGAATVLRGVYGLNGEGTAVAMTTAGYTVEQTTRCLKEVYGASDVAAARALSATKLGAANVASGIRSVYQLSDRAAGETMLQGGYAVDQLKSVFGSALDAAESVADKAKETAETVKDEGKKAVKKVEDFFKGKLF
jgi:hypothetical protein